jgi:putative two-component system response regulator
MACFERAVALAPSAGPFLVVLRSALNNIASCALHLGEIERGLEASRRAIEVNPAPVSAPECLSRAVAESNRARLLLLAGDPVGAAGHARQAASWAVRHPSPRTELLALMTQGLWQVHAGDVASGLDQVRQALDLARRHLPAEVHDMLDACVTAYRHAGQAEVAMVYLHELQSLHRQARSAHALAQHHAHVAGLPAQGLPAAPPRIEAVVTQRQGLLRGELGGREALRARMLMLEQQSVAAELHDDVTGRHCYRVGRLASLLAREIGLEDDVCFLIDLAARLHDIGKLAVPDALLLKPGALTPEERAIMETHTVAGAQILARSEVPHMHVAEAIARHHHERWDGSGYPDRLAGFAIPIAARVTALADVFDALTHERPYKRAWGVDEALREIAALRARHFDPALTDVFLALVPRLQREVGDLDAYLGAEAEHSPFVQAREQVARALRQAGPVPVQVQVQVQVLAGR